MKIIKMDYQNSQKLEREKLETNMIFLGLMIVKNKVKSETKPSIEILKNARLKMVMATGDNMLTAISVAKECSLIKSDLPIYMVEIDNDNKLVFNLVEKYHEETEIRESLKNLKNSLFDSIISNNSMFANYFQPDFINFNDFSEKNK